MISKKKVHPEIKTELHQRNKHRERYNFKELISCCPELEIFVKLNDYNDWSIDFFNPQAVKTLNKALLKFYYGINYWDIPSGYLCPPIPGRADYVHSVADLISVNNQIPTGNKIKILDIGVGASMVYPIIGIKEYEWTFVGSDIDPVAINSCNTIIEANPFLKNKIELRLQKNPKNIFIDVIQKEEFFDITICNPPFHASSAEAHAATKQKFTNLKKQRKINNPILNFGGRYNELCCDGGEEKFVKTMIQQSKQFSKSCLWFTTLISKSDLLNNVYLELENVNATQVKTIPMGQGNKISRIVAWTFFSPEEIKKYFDSLI